MLLTKVPFSTVKDIMTKAIRLRKQPGKQRPGIVKFRSIEEAVKDLIRRKNYDMYNKQKVPTIHSLQKELIVDETNISYGEPLEE